MSEFGNRGFIETVAGLSKPQISLRRHDHVILWFSRRLCHRGANRTEARPGGRSTSKGVRIRRSNGPAPGHSLAWREGERRGANQ